MYYSIYNSANTGYKASETVCSWQIVLLIKVCLRRACVSLAYFEHYCSIKEVSSLGEDNRNTLLLDITRWHGYLKHFNDINLNIHHGDVYSALTDACILAGGAFYNDDFSYVNWQEDYPNVCDLPMK